MAIDSERPMDLWEINPKLGQEINDLICLRSKCETIDEYLDIQLKAWELIPSPPTQFYTPTGSLALGISDSYFQLSKFKDSLKWALIAFESRKPLMSALYPFILGKIYYELNDFENSYNFFDIAYDIDKYHTFSTEDKKYWIFYKNEKEKKKK